MLGGMENRGHNAQPANSVGSMRVVILEPDSEIRRILRQSIDEQPDFRLVGESHCGADCAALLDDFGPELLIARTEHSSAFSRALGPFPLRIELRAAGLRAVHRDAFETMDIPITPAKICEALARARCEILRRKLDELACLLHRYVNYSGESRQQPRTAKIQVGCNIEIPVEEVTYIAADGNYMKVYARGRVHEFRDTMVAVSERLDHSVFRRVHRSFIVNRSHVTNVLRKDGAAVALALSDGSEIPVGPNYRSEVDRLENAGRRVSA